MSFDQLCRLIENHILTFCIMLWILESYFIMFNILELPYISHFNILIFFDCMGWFTSKLQISSTRIWLIACDIVWTAWIIHYLVSTASSASDSHVLHLLSCKPILTLEQSTRCPVSFAVARLRLGNAVFYGISVASSCVSQRDTFSKDRKGLIY